MLSVRRREAINEELQQMHARLLALTDELAAGATPGNKYASISKATKFAAGGVEYVQQMMILARQPERVDRVRA